MEEHKLKHVCKFCKKRFVSGRSLGGHIRCHLPKQGYGLRENPKKSWRIVHNHHHVHVDDLKIKSSTMSSSSSSETEFENLRLSHLGKGKRSSLVGSNNNNNSSSCFSEVVEVEEHEEVEENVAMCLIMLSRDVGPWGDGKKFHGNCSKDKRKRVKKIQGNDDQSVFTAVNGENFVFLPSEDQQNGLKLKGVGDLEVSANGLLSNDQSFSLSESKWVKKVQEDESAFTAVNGENFVFLPSEDQQNGLKLKGVEVSANGLLSNDQSFSLFESKRVKKAQGNDDQSVFTAVNGGNYVFLPSEDQQNGLKLKGVEISADGLLSNDQSSNLSERKRVKQETDQFPVSENVEKAAKLEEFQKLEKGFFLSSDQNSKDHEFGTNNDENSSMNSDLFKITTPGKKNCSKRTKFECITCNKVFCSYQALGGHKASHKKNFGENFTEEQTFQSEKTRVFDDISLGSSSKFSKKKVQKHECPICYRAFTSGQALGGHKRSHLIGEQHHHHQNIDVVERSSSSSETREMLDLDLNLLPANDAEDNAATTTVPATATATAAAASSSSNSVVGLIKPYWWVETPHKLNMRDLLA